MTPQPEPPTVTEPPKGGFKQDYITTKSSGIGTGQARHCGSDREAVPNHAVVPDTTGSPTASVPVPTVTAAPPSVTPEMVERALAVEVPGEPGVTFREDIGGGAMELMLRAALEPSGSVPTDTP